MRTTKHLDSGFKSTAGMTKVKQYQNDGVAGITGVTSMLLLYRPSSLSAFIRDPGVAFPLALMRTTKHLDSGSKALPE